MLIAVKMIFQVAQSYVSFLYLLWKSIFIIFIFFKFYLEYINK